MKQTLGLVSLVVREYDEAIAFYVGILGFTLVEDRFIPEQNKRWVVVAPPGSTESYLLLARAASAEQSARIGNQTGGRVFLFLYTDSIARDYQTYGGKGVRLFASRRKSPTERSRCSRTSTVICGTSSNRGHCRQMATPSPSLERTHKGRPRYARCSLSASRGLPAWR
jgi:catechol 2,3-dioxygenase-like lactoylglutathione lyase family enzyme